MPSLVLLQRCSLRFFLEFFTAPPRLFVSQSFLLQTSPAKDPDNDLICCAVQHWTTPWSTTVDFQLGEHVNGLPKGILCNKARRVNLFPPPRRFWSQSQRNLWRTRRRRPERRRGCSSAVCSLSKHSNNLFQIAVCPYGARHRKRKKKELFGLQTKHLTTPALSTQASYPLPLFLHFPDSLRRHRRPFLSRPP